MIKASLLFISLLGAATLHAAPGFKITGKVKGGVEGMKVYLKYVDVSYAERKNLDSAVLQNGQFTFSGDVSSPRYCEILFRDVKQHPSETYEDKMINLFVENAAIQVNASYDGLGMEYDPSGQKPGAVTVTGSKSQEAYMAYEKNAQVLNKQFSTLFEEYIKIINDKGDTSMESRYHKGVPVTMKMDDAAHAANAFSMAFILHHKPDAVNAYIASGFLRTSAITTAQVDSLLHYFGQAASKDFLVNRFMETAPGYQRTAVGSSIVDMSFVDSTGKTYALRDYIGKGKYVMLECWASWCGPCRADIPHLKAVYKDFHPQGFEIISVSLDSEKAKWLKALGQEQMPWLQLSDLHAFDGDLPKTYHINGIPHCLLFDPQGKLVTTNMRGSWMDKRLVEMYGDHFSKL